jgi:hypothetical protein
MHTCANKFAQWQIYLRSQKDFCRNGQEKNYCKKYLQSGGKRRKYREVNEEQPSMKFILLRRPDSVQERPEIEFVDFMAEKLS